MGVFIVTAIGAVVVALLGLWSARAAKEEHYAKKQAEALEREKEKAISSIKAKNDSNRNQASTGALNALSGEGQPVSHPR
ncbi:MAG TPA: hypothetical protein VGZ91_04095 [Candidatus Sulfotelmatobacter sp.]|jgi:Na+-transporting methylmalonyl-CoA/oxaloacetate decarboxylase gamma subunit|nr:hypothetical protein [Candidatus Sulfotelmatobacter sp.]